MSEDEFKKNLDVSFDELIFTACSISEKDDEGRAFLFLGAQTGEVLTYSLPDFNLVGVFKTQNDIFMLEASVRKKYVMIADRKDWVCRRYAFNGKLLNEYDLNFPPADSSDSTERLIGALSPFGEKFAVGNAQGAIRVLDVETDELIVGIPNAQIEGAFSKCIVRIFWLDEERFLSLGNNGDCCVWNLNEIGADGVPSSIPIDCGMSTTWSAIQTAAFSPKTQKLILADVNFKLRFIDVNEGKVVAQTMGITATRGNFTSLSAFGYLPEKNAIILWSLTSPFDSLKLIDADSFEEIRGFNLDPDETPTKDWFDAYNMLTNACNIATKIATRSVGSEFAVATTSGEIVFFNADESKPIYKIDDFPLGTELRQISIKDCNVPIIVVDPEGRRLIGKTTFGDEFVLWDWKSKEEIRRWKTSAVLKEDMKQYEQQLESGAENLEEEIVFDSNDDSLIPTEDSKKNDDEVKDVDPSQGTAELFFLDDDKVLEITTGAQLKLWDVSTGMLIRSNKIKGSLLVVSLSNDRKSVVLGMDDGALVFVSTENLTTLSSFKPSYIQQSNLNSRASEANGEGDYGDVVLSDSMLSKTYVTSIGWSRGDKFLSVAFSNGCTSIFMVDEIVNILNFGRATFLTSFVVNRQDCVNWGYNCMQVGTFFTNNNRLITLDSNGLIQHWDYLPSKETATSLLWYTDKIRAGNVRRQECAGIWSIVNEFKIFSGTDCKYTAADKIEDFQYWHAPNGTSGYLILHTSNGKLSFIDGDGYKSVPSEIDERQGFPEKGMVRICVSPDGTKIAGIERQSYKTWLLDLSSPNSKWEQIPWRDEKARSFQLAFSPNSQILATVDDDVLRFWNVTTRQEIFRSNGRLFKGMATSCENKFKKTDATINDWGIIKFISEELIIQTGQGRGFYIWNVKDCSVFQKEYVQSISSFEGIDACECLNKGIGREKPTTFVIGGDDGVLRFYQLSKDTNKFEQIYVISRLKFNGLEVFEKRNSERKYDSGEILFLFDGVDGSSLSEDGKTLFVSSGKVCSYDMEEIWKNIDELPKKWQEELSKGDIEPLTDLRFNSSGELTPFVPNRMIRVDK